MGEGAAGAGATGAGATGAAGGDGARGADGGGLGRLDLRMAGAGAGDAPRLGTVRNAVRRRTAARVATRTGVAGVFAGATTGGCTARAGPGVVVGRAAVLTGASGLRCRALMPNVRTATSTTAVIAPL